MTLLYVFLRLVRVEKGVNLPIHISFELIACPQVTYLVPLPFSSMSSFSCCCQTLIQILNFGVQLL